MLYLHILAGTIALASGFVALLSLKGQRTHRKSGAVFTVAMLWMTMLGALMASWNSEPVSVVSTIMAMFTYYLVSTGVMVVQVPVERSRWLHAAFMLAAFAIAYGAFDVAALAAAGADGRYDGVPARAYQVLGSIVLLCAVFDARLLWRGHIEGAPRLIRHLWRMGAAMFVATGSFFLGQADEFPKELRVFPLLIAPVLLVLGTTLVWFLRMRFGWRIGHLPGMRNLARRNAQAAPGTREAVATALVSGQGR